MVAFLDNGPSGHVHFGQATREPEAERSLESSRRPRRRAAASSVAPVASGYERALRPCIALTQDTATTKRHSAPSSKLITLRERMAPWKFASSS